jgi:hypothetical protein
MQLQHKTEDSSIQSISTALHSEHTSEINHLLHILDWCDNRTQFSNVTLVNMALNYITSRGKV